MNVRAVLLSDTRVHQLLNAYFVPVYVSATGTPADREVINRIKRMKSAMRARRLIAENFLPGPVHATILDENGEFIEFVDNVGNVMKGTNFLVGQLQSCVDRLKLQPGKKLASYVPLADRPKEAEALRMHIVARWGANAMIPTAGANAQDVVDLTTNYNRMWVPAEHVVDLEPDAWKRLTPTPGATVGSRWMVDANTSNRFLIFFCPPTEVSTLTAANVNGSLEAVIESIDNGVAHVALKGRIDNPVRLWLNYDDRVARSALVGYLDYDLGSARIRSFKLVTDNGLYGGATGSPIPFAATMSMVE